MQPGRRYGGLQRGCRDADEDGEDDGDEVDLTLPSVAFVASVARPSGQTETPKRSLTLARQSSGTDSSAQYRTSI